MAEKQNAGSSNPGINITSQIAPTVSTAATAKPKQSRHACKPTVEQVNDPEFIGSYGGAVRATCKGCGCETAVRANARRALAELDTLCTRDKA